MRGLNFRHGPCVSTTQRSILNHDLSENYPRFFMQVPSIFGGAHILITFPDSDVAMDPFARSNIVWTAHQLATLNIAILSLPPAKFFPTPDPRLLGIDRVILKSTGIDPAILNALPGKASLTISVCTFEFLVWLDEATRATHETSLTSFTLKILEILEFNERPAHIRLDFNIPLTIYGKTGTGVLANLCLVHRSFILLVVVNKKTNGYDAESQVIAGAIAAFQLNNENRKNHRLDPLDAMTIPCITMIGTHPDFYLVPVTTALSDAVITGRRPATQTEVLCCPTEAIPTWRAGVGMSDIRYRKLALKRFLAFKELAKRHWAPILEGL